MKKMKKKKIKIYVDGTDAAYHIPDDAAGIRVYFDVDSMKQHNKCWEECGIIQLELDMSKPKVVVPENPKLARKNAISGDQVIVHTIKSGFKDILKALKAIKWAVGSYITSRYYRFK